jgi:hypothetical protein
MPGNRSSILDDSVSAEHIKARKRLLVQAALVIRLARKPPSYLDLLCRNLSQLQQSCSEGVVVLFSWHTVHSVVREGIAIYYTFTDRVLSLLVAEEGR